MGILKELFTCQFVKDLAWSAVILVILYVITHNSLVRPVPIRTEGVWSIHFMQHPLIFGLAGHNYLALYDADGGTVSELHGLATDPDTNEWKYIGTRSTNLLKVWEFDRSKYYRSPKDLPGRVMAQGTEEDSKALWNKARQCKEMINDRNLPYPSFGFSVRNETINSNSVAYTLAKCMGLDTRHIGLITPGSKLDLLEDYFESLLTR